MSLQSSVFFKFSYFANFVNFLLFVDRIQLLLGWNSVALEASTYFLKRKWPGMVIVEACL